MSKVFIAVLLLCATISYALVDVPLKKISILNGDNYSEESFYTFNLDVNQQTLQSIVDIQSNVNWVVDKTCTNCFPSGSSTQEKAFSCGSSCSAAVVDNPTLKVLGSKIRGVKHNPASADAKIDETSFKIESLLDITEIKNSALIKEQESYLDQVHAGLGFGVDSIADQKSSLNSIVAAGKITPKQFSLHFSKDGGRLVIGKSNDEAFFGDVENSTFLNTVLDSEDKSQSWSVKVGPNFKVADAPSISTQFDDVPSQAIEDLNTAHLDSTTKFVKVPISAWNRLDKTLFQHHSCSFDQNNNYICSCEGAWPNISLDLVKDPSASSLEGNTHAFELQSSSYLESIGSDKCLLLIKAQESDANLDYVLGTSFLQNFYSVYNAQQKTIQLSKSHQLEEQSLVLDDNYRLPLIIAGSVVGLASVGALLAIFKKVQAPSNAEIQSTSQQQGNNRQAKSQLHNPTSISYIVRSPRQVDSLPQVTKVQNGSPVRSRVVNSPPRNTAYAQQLYYQYQ